MTPLGRPKLEYLNSGRIDRVGPGSITPTRGARKAGVLGYIGGWATRYAKPHIHKSRIEVMMVGCFATTLAKQQAVRFLIDHDEGQLVATSDDNLMLRSDEVGLAFILTVPATDAGEKALRAVESGRMAAMSVGYETVETEAKQLAGEQCYLVRSARLNEISLVSRGAVSQAYAKVIARPDFSLVLEDAAGADRAAEKSKHEALRARASAAASDVSSSFRNVINLLGAMGNAA
ncbi:HK97 family phage prohead protease [Bradyrhizobium sp. CCBAU 53338]|uniref:HK97 family phage prohead protease n=1 Tax=Bradyrhizobium sp. CCBAU 53338 TaxID=1325111 RepID=UPI00188D6D85|nr:HK97 family phage prohead protease [Bradyrhizobium sp. CCBAU 53338]QOZ52944.1 HK97 family phage prohead protease [Bradyrhizobium sp. CCBAU 53338]